MRIYLDEDIASALLTQLLRRAGHDVQLPADLSLGGEPDAVVGTFSCDIFSCGGSGQLRDAQLQ